VIDMSTLVAPVVTVVDKIPLGRRIEELKKEKGGYYSNVAMAGRLGMHTETLRSMLKGKREIYTFELDKIAKDLKMPVERILQEDVREEIEQLETLLELREKPTIALEIGLKMEEQAIGVTERCHALHRLGRAFENTHQYQEYNNELRQAYQLALQIQDQYGDSNAMYSVMYHLMASYTAIKDYVTASKILDEILPFFVETPKRQSALCYQKAMIEETNGNLRKALQYATESLKYAEESKIPVLVAKTRLNLAHFHYQLTDYRTSRELLEPAIDGLSEDTRTQLIARKELVKTYLKMHVKELALDQIEIALVDAKDIMWMDMVGKLTILLTLSTNNPSHAQSVLDNERHSLKIRWLSCRCLRGYYKALNDGAMFLHYSKIAEGFCADFPDFLNEGEL
jgi:tetratricopeptide (TPR) repeat protein